MAFRQRNCPPSLNFDATCWTIQVIGKQYSVCNIGVKAE